MTAGQAGTADRDWKCRRGLTLWPKLALRVHQRARSRVRMRAFVHAGMRAGVAAGDASAQAGGGVIDPALLAMLVCPLSKQPLRCGVRPLMHHEHHRCCCASRCSLWHYATAALLSRAPWPGEQPHNNSHVHVSHARTAKRGACCCCCCRLDAVRRELVSDAIGVAWPIVAGVPRLMPHLGRMLDDAGAGAK